MEKQRSRVGRTAVVVSVCALVAVAVVLSGCSGSDDTPVAGDEVHVAVMGAGQIPMAPGTHSQMAAQQAVQTNAKGKAWLTIRPDGQAIEARVEHTNLEQVTKVHIHAGAVGHTGPHVISVYEGEGVFTSPFVRTLTVADFAAHPQAGYTSFSDALNAIRSGNTYLNVHTTPYPAGEIRGQIGAAEVRAELLGGSIVPPVQTDANGAATLRFNNLQSVAYLTLRHHGLMNVTSGHVHVGRQGENGPHLLNFFPLGGHGGHVMSIAQAHDSNGNFMSPFIVSLGHESFEPHPEVGTHTFDDAVRAILSQRAYINLHTEQFPAGEIRGQLLP